MADKKSVSTKVDEKSKDNVPAEGGDKNPKSDKSEDKESVTLTEEQWEAAFKHPRFQELSKKAKLAEELEKKEKEAEEEKLKREGKLKELLEKKDAELSEMKDKMSKSQIEYEIRDKANKLGIVDAEVAAKLIDFGKIEKDDSGNPTNVESLLGELVEQKPYLVGKVEKANVGSGANTSTEDQGAKPIWAQSELREKLQDHKWYLEHQEEVESAQKEGRIDPTK